MALKLVRNSCLDRQVSVLLEVDVSTFSDFAAPLRWIVSLWTEDKGRLASASGIFGSHLLLEKIPNRLDTHDRMFSQPLALSHFVSQTWSRTALPRLLK